MDRRMAVVDGNGIVINVVTLSDGSDWRPPDGATLVEDASGAAEPLGSYDGAAFHPAPDGAHPRTPEAPVAPPTLADFQAAIDGHVDAVAGARNYSSGTSCASYAASTVPQWQAEAAAFIAWRDAVWAYAYAELDKVENGQRLTPAVADFVDELPAIVWP